MSGEEKNVSPKMETPQEIPGTIVITPAPISNNVSTVALEGYLLQTLLDLQCRSEVEATLNDLVADVELAVTLENELKVKTHQSQAEQIIATQALAIEETHVVQKDRLQAQTLLADALVKDLWSLSKEVGSLLELKQKHQAMIFEYDELMAKLAQAEENLYAARHRTNQQQSPVGTTVSSVEGAAAAAITPGATPVAMPETTPPATAATPAPAAEAKSIALQDLTPSATTAADAASISTPAAVAAVAAATTKPAPVAPVVQPTATIVQLPDKPAAAPSTASITSATSNNSASKAEATKPDTRSTIQAATTTAALKSETAEKSPPSNPTPVRTVPEEKSAVINTFAPVVALVGNDADDGEDPVTLETLDMEILMRIFGFLEAHDILNTAQINISMYSRVDSLFGFGADGGTTGADDNVSTTSTLATTPTVAAATATTASLSTTKSTTATAATKPVGSSTAVSNPTTKTATGAAPATNNPIFGQFGAGRNIFNNLLQGGVVGGGGGGAVRSSDASTTGNRAASPKNIRARGRGGGSDADSGNKPPLSEAMAHSMAAKLNDAEINAIISMTEKLRTKEKQVMLLNKEKEEMEGKLSGSEAVKKFLISKVKDMEEVMNRSDETEKKVTQQIASDQEVIAFLDGRVQELERLTRVMQKEKTAAQEKLKLVVAQNDKKVAVLSDMLQFERQKLKESERDWKATKKLLVKEVKGCRATIVNLQAERDGFRQQNDALRKAVMASGSNTSSGGR